MLPRDGERLPGIGQLIVREVHRTGQQHLHLKAIAQVVRVGFGSPTGQGIREIFAQRLGWRFQRDARGAKFREKDGRQSPVRLAERCFDKLPGLGGRLRHVVHLTREKFPANGAVAQGQFMPTTGKGEVAGDNRRPRQVVPIFEYRRVLAEEVPRIPLVQPVFV